MGTKMPSTYVTLILANLEENQYEIIGKRIQQQYEKIIFFTSGKRYLYDRFVFWKCL